jgi:hypothetical protein
MILTTLQEKQRYYLFGENGYSFKEPPVLPEELLRGVRALGTNEYGDPLWRYQWMGVAIYRDDPENPRPTAIRGPKEATKIVNGFVVPRYLHVNARQLVYLCYRDKKGHICRVKRPEQVPAGILSWDEFEYVMYGKIRFYLQRWLTSKQLIEAGEYTEEDVPVRGDYFTVSDGPIETADGLYYEPDEYALDALKAHLLEEQTEKHDDIMRQRAERREERNFKQKLRSLEEMAGLVENALSEPIPTAKTQFAQPEFKNTGDIITL